MEDEAPRRDVVWIINETCFLNLLEECLRVLFFIPHREESNEWFEDFAIKS